jgi:hypothetical protein
MNFVDLKRKGYCVVYNRSWIMLAFWALLAE